MDKLSPDQILELHDSILKHMDRSENRRFEFAMDRANKNGASQKLNVRFGGSIALAGILAAVYPAATGNDIIAGVIATAVTIIIAVVIGGKMSNRPSLQTDNLESSNDAEQPADFGPQRRDGDF